jgi:hypothetical protein
LVTAELESRWNRALQRVREVEQKLAHHDAVSPNETTLPVEDLAALGANLEHIWCAPGTDAKLKKRIVRTVIREVVADLDNETSEIVLLVHWAGGAIQKSACQSVGADSATQHHLISSKPFASLPRSSAMMSSPGS